jgi:hypothetical protein
MKLKGGHQIRSDAPVPMTGLNPELLQFATGTPPAAHGTADDCAGISEREARQWLDLVQRRSSIVRSADAIIDQGAFNHRMIVMRFDRDVRHGVCCAA